MKKYLSRVIVLLITFVFCLQFVNAEESLLTKIENGGTVDINLVDPVNLTKTINHMREKYLAMRMADSENPLSDDDKQWADEFYTPVGMVGEIITPYISANIKDKNVYVYVYDCDSEYNCKVSITYIGDVGLSGDEHIYDVKFKLNGVYDSKIEDEMIELYDKIDKILERTGNEEGVTEFYKIVLEDISMVDYLYNMSNYDLSRVFLMSNSINYADKIREINKKNYNFFVTLDAGDDLPALSGFGGRLLFGDKNSVYFANEYGGLMNYRYVIYIDEKTEDTKEAYIAAAKKRIHDYYGKDILDIEYGETIKEYWIDNICSHINREEEDGEEHYLECTTTEIDDLLESEYSKFNMMPYMYKVTINGKDYHFLIAKDNSKLNYPTGLNTIDYSTDISIESTDTSIPLDSKIILDLFDKNSENYANIANNHKGYDFYDIFDIKLFSSNADKYISKLDNGYFRVKLPLKEEYQNKELYAYYFKDDGSVEKYKIYTEDNYVYFDTNHFSVYSIGYSDNNEEVDLKEISQTGAGTNKISLKWNRVDDANGYFVQVKSGSRWKTVKTIKNVNTTTATIKKLRANTKYTYRVIAYKVVKKKNKTINTTNSVKAKTSPISTKITIKSSTYNSIKVGIKKVSGASRYVVYRSTSKKGTYEKIGETDTTSYKDKELVTGKTYYYKVKACNKYCSGYSKIISKKITLASPSLKVKSYYKGQATIKAGTVDGEDGYIIERSTNSRKGFKKITDLDVSEKSFVDESNLKAKKYYYYRVKAYKLVDGKKVYGKYSKVVRVKISTKKQVVTSGE